jgi:hypothetical protein
LVPRNWFGADILWYTSGITDICRIAAILCCMAQIQSKLGFCSCHGSHLTSMAARNVGDTGALATKSPGACGSEEMEATPGIEPGYTVLQTVA